MLFGVIIGIVSCPLLLGSALQFAHPPPVDFKLPKAVEPKIVKPTVAGNLPSLVKGNGHALLPGEFAPQDAILVSQHLCRYACYQKLAFAIISSGMKLLLATSSGLIPPLCLISGQNLSNIMPVQAMTESVWIRDYGQFVTVHSDGTFRIRDFHYPRNYNNNYLDDAFPANSASALCSHNNKYCRGYNSDDPFKGMLLEGGNFLPSGDGLCLVSDAILCQTGDTSKCRQNEFTYALSPPYGKSMDWIRFHLANELGCTDLRVLQGYYGDPLNHVDMYMTFASSTDLILGSFDDTDPLNKDIYLSNRALLQDLTSSGLRIHEVPMPSQCKTSTSCASEPSRIHRTFLNGLFLPSSGEFIMPTYSITYDNYAQKQIQAENVFTNLGWTVIQASADELILEDGAFHCVTRNLPSYSSRAHVQF